MRGPASLPASESFDRETIFDMHMHEEYSGILDPGRLGYLGFKTVQWNTVRMMGKKDGCRSGVIRS